MAIDALTAQLLTGGGNNAGGLAGLGALDPTLAAVQPELQLAQGMEQQGTSTAPAYPGAAIARALQGAIGAGLQKSAISDLGNAYSKSLPALANLFKGTQLGDAIESGNPMAIQMALKVAPQVMAASSVPRSLSQGEQVYTGNNPGPQNTNPLSDKGKEILDAGRLQAQGNQPAANAITSGVNKAGVLDSGVRVPPVPLNVGQRPPVTGTGGVPSAAIPLPQQPQVGGQPTAQAPQANAQPTQQQMDAAKGQLADKLTQVAQSGVTNPSATGVGDLPAQIAAAKGQQKDAEDTGAANAKYYDSLRRGLSGSATIAAQQKQNIDVLRQIAASPNFTPGAGSDAALWLQRVAAQAGIKTAGAAPRELFNQVSARVLADQMSGIKSMASETGEAGGRIFKPMLDLEEKANITPEDSLAGIKAKLDLLDNTGNLMMKWGNNANDYLKSHPRLDSQFESGLRADIAGARVPNAVPGAASATPAATPAMQTFSNPADVHAAVAAKKLQSGQKFLTPDGRIGTVP